MLDGRFKVGREALVDLLSQSYSSEAPPSPDLVRSNVHAYLAFPAFASLVAEAEWIINEVLKRIDVRVGRASVLQSDQGHVEWLSQVDRSEWRLWKRLKHYLQHGIRLPPNVLAELERSTDKVLEQLENPHREGRWDRRGMVVGHVQSGKTTHYTSLACKALDAGYRVVIVIAGMHDNLRSQTQFRVDQYVLGRDTRRRSEGGGAEIVAKIGAALHAASWGLDGPEDSPKYAVTTCTSAEEDGDFKEALAQQVWFELSEHNRLVMVVKKNAGILRRMTRWLNKLLASGHGGINHPTLVIDDEADQASVNTRESEDPTRINELIRRLVGSLTRVGYIGYTATPFANIFIDADFEHEDPKLGRDLFPRDFIVNLKAPSDYVGPETVFGHDGDESVGLPERPPLPMFVEVNDAEAWLPPKHKKHQVPGPLPASLLDAIRLFACICAARRARGHLNNHNSMLVHATRFTAVQNRVVEQIRDELDVLRNIVSHGGPKDRARILNELHNTWNARVVAVHDEFRSQLPDCPSLPEWSAIENHLGQSLEAITVLEINGTSDDSLAYASHPNGRHVIAIGGDKLSRGLTLEDLSVSYFLRASNTFDTLMQMGRWFGYRPQYLDLCRVYTTASLYSAFREVALATEELRNDLDRMAAVNRKPIDFGLRVRRPSPKLMITAANKMKLGQVVTLRFGGEMVQALEVPLQGRDAEANRRALEELIKSLPAPTHPTRAAVSSHFVWNRVPPSSVLGFLEEFTAYRDSSFLSSLDRKCDPVCKYIRDREEAGELIDWTVCLVSKRTGNTVKAAIGGLEVSLVHRKRMEAAADRFRTNTLAGRAEEAVDLSDREFADAVQLTNANRGGNAKPETDPGREEVRVTRPKERGLLLLYPLLPKPPAKKTDMPEDPAFQRSNFLVAAAISFPASSGASSIPYMVNPVWIQEFKYLMEDDDVDS